METTVLGLKAGSVIQDTYRIERLLGEGGMGATFLGINLATGHQVAIKAMIPEVSRNERALDLFKRESRLLRTVQNDAVVRYETTLQDKSGKLYLVMEYVPGRTLRYYIDKGARLASADVLKLGLRLADGLASIHALGIVHRDVAPDNIMVPDDDILGAKFIDFGLASNTIGTEKSVLGSDFAGKLQYCAPEQLGLFGNNVTPKTDIYALGLVMMRVAGLVVPGQDKGWAAIDDRREDVKIKEASISAPLRKALEALLRANPENRPIDVVSLLRKALDLETLDSKGAKEPQLPTPKEGQGPTSISKTPVTALMAAALVVALAGGGWFFLSKGGKSGTGASVTQADVAAETVAKDDPITEAVALINNGGEANLNAAFGALMALSQNPEQTDERRISASILIAEMYDPTTHDVARSPFARPNPAAARRYYQRAADLGSEEAAEAISRLSE
jgi:serine/threonine-protein kinase